MALSRATAIPLNRYVLFVALAVIGCASDLLTKHLVFEWMGAENPDIWWLWEPYVGVQTTVNQGALFGMGQGFSAVFASLSVFAGVGIVAWLFYFGAARDLWLTLALGSVSGGIMGNLYDRLGLWHDADAPAGVQYGVRDWVLLRYQTYDWPNFNIADCLLVVGAIMLVVHAFFYKEESADSPAATEDAK